MKADWLQLPDTAGYIPPRRLTLAVLLGLVVLAVLASTPRSAAQELIPAPHPSVPPALVVGRQPDPERRTEAPWVRAGASLPSPTVAALRPPVLVTGSMSGIASTYGPGYDGLTASRWPRGTVLRICGPGGCATRTTNDYGPSRRLFPERLVDLDVATFERICGCYWRRGTVPVEVWLL